MLDKLNPILRYSAGFDVGLREFRKALKSLVDESGGNAKQYVGAVDDSACYFKKRSVIPSMVFIEFMGEYVEKEEKVQLDINIGFTAKYLGFVKFGFLIFILMSCYFIYLDGISTDALKYLLVPVAWYVLLRAQLVRELGDFRQTFEKLIEEIKQ